MRLIGEINEPEQARKFAAFLLTEGITPQVEQGNGAWEIWVKEEDHLDQAVEELARFQSDPDATRYDGAVERADRIFHDKEVRRREYKKNVVDVSSQPRFSRASGRRGPLTTVLLIASILAFVMTDFGADFESNVQDNLTYRALSSTYVVAPESLELVNKYDKDALPFRLASIFSGEIWRLVTPIFIHFGILHIVFNMMWLFQLGSLIENRFGTLHLAVIVLVSAVLSNLIQQIVPVGLDGSCPVLIGRDNILIGTSGGMSGVVYALFGFVWMKSMYDPNAGFRIPDITVIIMIGWLFACMIGIIPNIANWAHGVGLVVGMLFGYLPVLLRK